mgnify:FL=1
MNKKNRESALPLIHDFSFIFFLTNTVPYILLHKDFQLPVLVRQKTPELQNPVYFHLSQYSGYILFRHLETCRIDILPVPYRQRQTTEYYFHSKIQRNNHPEANLHFLSLFTSNIFTYKIRLYYITIFSKIKSVFFSFSTL